MTICRCLLPLVLLLSLVLLPVSAQEQKHEDAPAPQATPAIQQTLNEIKSLLQNGKASEALPLAENALKQAKETHDVVGEARSLRAKATVLEKMEKNAEAVTAYKEAAFVWAGVGDGPGQADALGNASALLPVEQAQEANALLNQALALGKAETKRPLTMAAALHGVGNKMYEIGRLADAQRIFEVTLVIRTRCSPNSLEVAYSLGNLGTVVRLRGDLVAAEDYYRRSLEIEERLAPESLDIANGYNNMGLAASDRGDLAAAEDYYQRSLALREKLAPGSVEVATCLNNLGTLASDRGDLDAAEDYHRRALAIREKLEPDSLPVTSSLINLGTVLHLRGNFAAAEGYYQRSLALREKLAPGSVEVADCLNNLGSLATDRGKLDEAEAYHNRSLAIKEKLAPNSMGVAYSLENLGTVARARGNLDLAANYFKRSIAYQERLAPDALSLAFTLNDLGGIALKKNLPLAALPLFQRAVAIIENQREAIPNPESRRLLTEQNADPFLGEVRTYLLLNRPQEAFHALERFRARALTDSLAERRFNLNQGLPPDLRDRQAKLDNQRRIAETDLALAHERTDKSAEAQARKQLDILAARQRQLDADLRKRMPRYAQLQYPQPLTLTEAQKALDPGTLLLSYFVDDDKTILFALTRASFQTYTFALKKADLARQIEQARKVLASSSATREEFEPVLRALYTTLVAPAQTEVAASKRLLVCGDGPLLKLPFATLMPAPKHYLIQDKPIHTIASMTAYKSLRDDRSPGEKTLLALGDPVYDSVTLPKKDVSMRPKQMGMKLERLPRTRPLARAIGQLFAPHSRVLLDKEATLANIQKQSGSKRVLHLGCHGWADDHDPLGSWLALTPQAKGDNGLLYAWQVLGMKLDCDLVTLAACETGLGVESKSEGVLGLARAFQVAGAQSVLVSLWSVDEEATVRLMLDFYRQWKAGKSKDEALREAQLRLVGTNQPYLWAAFVLNGDWK